MSPGGGPRLLLRRLREIMAEQTSAQMRLDKLVTVIASNMVAEVCSIYLRRAGKILELFATEGLNRAAARMAGSGWYGLTKLNLAAVAGINCIKPSAPTGERNHGRNLVSR